MKTILKLSLIIFLFLVSSLAYGVTQHKQVFGYQFFIVTSESMKPAIEKGTLLFVKDSPEYSSGDIITFRYPLRLDRTITHRIVAFDHENRGYITQGDAHSMQDPWVVTEDLIIGTMTLQIPYVGYAIDFVRKPVGLLLVIVIPVVVMLMQESHEIYKYAYTLRDDARIRKIAWVLNRKYKTFEKQIIRINTEVGKILRADSA